MTNVPVPGLGGRTYGRYSGFCLEDQAFPDAVHHPHAVALTTAIKQGDVEGLSRLLAAEHRVVPVTRKVLADSETPLSAYRKLAANRPGTFLLESAEYGLAYASGLGATMTVFHLLNPGDRVQVELTPYDLTRGRITYRFK